MNPGFCKLSHFCFYSSFPNTHTANAHREVYASPLPTILTQFSYTVNLHAALAFRQPTSPADQPSQPVSQHARQLAPPASPAS